MDEWFVWLGALVVLLLFLWWVDGPRGASACACAAEPMPEAAVCPS